LSPQSALRKSMWIDLSSLSKHRCTMTRHLHAILLGPISTRKSRPPCRPDLTTLPRPSRRPAMSSSTYSLLSTLHHAIHSKLLPDLRLCRASAVDCLLTVSAWDQGQATANSMESQQHKQLSPTLSSSETTMLQTATATTVLVFTPLAADYSRVSSRIPIIRKLKSYAIANQKKVWIITAFGFIGTSIDGLQTWMNAIGKGRWHAGQLRCTVNTGDPTARHLHTLHSEVAASPDNPELCMTKWLLKAESVDEESKGLANPDMYGRTPLHYACLNGNLCCVKALVTTSRLHPLPNHVLTVLENPLFRPKRTNKGTIPQRSLTDRVRLSFKPRPGKWSFLL
jgi:hypothetical protein